MLMSDDFREELLRVAFVLLWHKTFILELPACLLLIILYSRILIHHVLIKLTCMSLYFVRRCK